MITPCRIAINADIACDSQRGRGERRAIVVCGVEIPVQRPTKVTMKPMTRSTSAIYDASACWGNATGKA
jgi:hypothetical protein